MTEAALDLPATTTPRRLPGFAPILTFAVLIVLAAVFVPTAFIPGITGRLYQQFAVTIAISVLLSAFNALSLSPALAALLLKMGTYGYLRFSIGLFPEASAEFGANLAGVAVLGGIIYGALCA